MILPGSARKMPVVAIRYRFRQPLRASARAAFAWCTDFGPTDGQLFSHRTVRTVERLADDTFVLSDRTYPNGQLRRIRRLVRIDPTQRSWTNTHLDGPFRHSQFWYRIVPDGRSRSHLEFVGLKLESLPRKLSRAEVARHARANRDSDAREWRTHLAPALEKEARSRRSR